MSKTFDSKVETLVEVIPPKFRGKVRRDINKLRRMGVHSIGSLQAVLENEKLKPEYRSIACWMLGRIGNKRALEPLLRVFLSGAAGFTWDAATSIGILNGGRAVQPLVRCLRHASEVDKRAAAAYALRCLADKRALKALLESLSDQSEHPKVRGEAAEALASLRDRSAVSPLLFALDDASTEVRFWSAFALGQLGDRRALPKLRRLAEQDKSVLKGWWSVRREARDAISIINRRPPA